MKTSFFYHPEFFYISRKPLKKRKDKKKDKGSISISEERSVIFVLVGLQIIVRAY